MKNTYLQPLLQRADALLQRVHNEFGALREDQLNWKPSPEAWSVGQCLEHLITANTTYFKDFKKIATGNPKMDLWTRISPFSNLFGNLLLGATGPEVKRKSKTPPVFQPKQSNVPADIVARFDRHQQELKQYMVGTDVVEHRKFKIHSPAAAFITYRLDQAMTLLINHEERHINQASRVMGMEGFPR